MKELRSKKEGRGQERNFIRSLLGRLPADELSHGSHCNKGLCDSEDPLADQDYQLPG